MPAVLAVLFGYFLLLFWLSGDGARTRGEAFFYLPFEAGPTTHKKLPFVLRREEGPEGAHRHTATFKCSSPAALSSQASKIFLQLVACGTKIQIVSAKLVVKDAATGAELADFRVVPGTVLSGNQQVEFRRKRFSANMGSIESADVEVNILSRGSSYMAFWSEQSRDAPVSRDLWSPVEPAGQELGFASIYGWREGPSTGQPSCSRARLLAEMWGTSSSSAVYLAISASLLAMIGGTFLLLKFESARAALILGVSCVLFALGLVYVILIPPFQAPDEADHFLTYAYAMSGGDLSPLALDALKLANRGHFERMKFREEEKFAATDVGHPMSEAWASHVLRNDINRSPVARIVWTLVGSWLGPTSAGRALLELRISNICYLTACLALALTLAAWVVQPGLPSVWLAAPVVFVPSVIFFGTAVSNYPFLIGGYVLQSVALGLLWGADIGKASRRLQMGAGFLAGSGVVMAIGASDNGLFSAAFWMVLFPICCFLRGLRAEALSKLFREEARFVAAFLAAMSAGWLVIWTMTGSSRVIPEFLTWHVNRLLEGSGLRWVDPQVFVAIGFVVPFTLASVAGCLAGFGLRSSPLLRPLRAVLMALLVLCFGFLLIAPTVQIPEVHDSGGIVNYMLKVLYSFFEGFGPGSSDWLVVRSFWGEFGWLDTPLPEGLVQSLRLGMGIGLVLLFLNLWRERETSGRMGLFAGTFIALALCAVAVAAGYHVSGFGVHGRYLVALYLFALVPAFEGWRRTLSRVPARLRLPGRAVFCIGALGVQCVAWISILNRYF